MNRKLKITLKVISNTLLSAVIILAVLLVGVKPVGIDPLVVLSPSMEPNYPTGSLIYLVDVDPATLEVGDVITYRISEKTTATHRIMEIIADDDDPDTVRFRTKGDNNDTYDGKLVEFSQVEGKVIFCIPLLGKLVVYIQSPPGLYVALGTALSVILFVMVVDTLTEDAKPTKSKKQPKGDNSNEEH